MTGIGLFTKKMAFYRHFWTTTKFLTVHNITTSWQCRLCIEYYLLLPFASSSSTIGKIALYLSWVQCPVSHKSFFSWIFYTSTRFTLYHSKKKKKKFFYRFAPPTPRAPPILRKTGSLTSCNNTSFTLQIDFQWTIKEFS